MFDFFIWGNVFMHTPPIPGKCFISAGCPATDLFFEYDLVTILVIYHYYSIIPNSTIILKSNTDTILHEVIKK